MATAKQAAETAEQELREAFVIEQEKYQQKTRTLSELAALGDDHPINIALAELANVNAVYARETESEKPRNLLTYEQSIQLLLALMDFGHYDDETSDLLIPSFDICFLHLRFSSPCI